MWVMREALQCFASVWIICSGNRNTTEGGRDLTPEAALTLFIRHRFIIVTDGDRTLRIGCHIYHAEIDRVSPSIL